jgi:lipid A 3-O-deacylase
MLQSLSNGRELAPVFSLCAVAAISIPLIVPLAHAAPLENPWTIISPLGLIENDSFFGVADRHYTNGLYASATSPRKPQCQWCAALAQTLLLPGEDNSANYRYGVFVGQSMFTPEVLSSPVPDPKDRPYAGWVFLGGRLYRETSDILDRAEVSTGAVGPGSGADAVQRWWHALHWFGGVPPRGWHAQIKDEPGLVLSEQRIWRMGVTHGVIDSELLPEVNASAGNVFTYGGAGVTLRIGQHLQADWGPPRIQPALEGSDFVDFDTRNGLAWYLYAGVEGRAIARNIFLDGNSFQHSANVAKNPLLGDLNIGAGMIWKVIRFNASYILRTHEFRTQSGDDRFFSFSLSYAY